MTKSRIAEWILSQVLPPDRAASTVGDWLEDAPNRGNIWFWSSVFGTAASAIWNDFANNPRFVLGLAFRSSAPVTYLFVVLYQILLPHFVHRASWSLFALASVAWIIGIGVVTGRWIARRASGKQVAVCIATGLLPTILIGLVTILLPRFRTGPSIIVQSAVLGISLLVGALSLRQPERSVTQ